MSYIFAIQLKHRTHTFGCPAPAERAKFALPGSFDPSPPTSSLSSDVSTILPEDSASNVGISTQPAPKHRAKERAIQLEINVGDTMTSTSSSPPVEESSLTPPPDKTYDPSDDNNLSYSEIRERNIARNKLLLASLKVNEARDELMNYMKGTHRPKPKPKSYVRSHPYLTLHL